MNNIELALAKIARVPADMEADITIIDALSAKVREHAAQMLEKGPAISLAMGWVK